MKVQEHETVSPITAQSKLCGSRKYPYSPGGLLEILKRRGVTEANIFFFYRKLEFLEGKGGSNQKSLHGKGMDTIGPPHLHIEEGDIHCYVPNWGGSVQLPK